MKSGIEKRNFENMHEKNKVNLQSQIFFYYKLKNRGRRACFHSKMAEKEAMRGTSRKCPTFSGEESDMRIG